MQPSNELTQLLHDWRAGDADALSQLMPIVYEELRRIAKVHMTGERREHTLQPTALVNEVYVMLAGTHKTRWNDRAHFYAIASQLMRRVLVDHARARFACKRGGTRERISIEAVDSLAPDAPPPLAIDVLMLHEALEKLAANDPVKSRIIELRYFGGLTIEETSLIVDRTRKQVWQDSQFAKAWLLREIAARQAGAN